MMCIISFWQYMMECTWINLQSVFVLKNISSALKYDNTDFGVVSAILQLAAKYQVKHIRNDLIRGLSTLYPKTLGQWEIREMKATSPSGSYDPRKTIPHPMCVTLQFYSLIVHLPMCLAWSLISHAPHLH